MHYVTNTGLLFSGVQIRIIGIAEQSEGYSQRRMGLDR